jgi:hypothetical protein
MHRGHNIHLCDMNSRSVYFINQLTVQLKTQPGTAVTKYSLLLNRDSSFKLNSCCLEKWTYELQNSEVNYGNSIRDPTLNLWKETHGQFRSMANVARKYPHSVTLLMCPLCHSVTLMLCPLGHSVTLLVFTHSVTVMVCPHSVKVMVCPHSVTL